MVVPDEEFQPLTFRNIIRALKKSTPTWMSRYVRIYYGNYEEFFTNSHKPQKIKGLADFLLKNGYRVHLIPVDFVNCCIVEVLGVEVFRCNIRNLCFNVPPEDDIVCQRAVAAIKDASKRLRRANSHFWMHTVFKQILNRNEFTPRAIWPFNIEIKPMMPVEECIECCRILVTKKKRPGEYVPVEDIDITCRVKDDDDWKIESPKVEAIAEEVGEQGTIIGEQEENIEEIIFEEYVSISDKTKEECSIIGTKDGEGQDEAEVEDRQSDVLTVRESENKGRRLVSINVKETDNEQGY